MEKMKEITAKANKVLQNADSSIYTGKRIDIVKLAKTFGFEVGISKKLPIREDGFIFVAPDGTKRIVVNKFRSVEDKRFTVAHELGHYFLHIEKADNLVLLREHKKDIEPTEKNFEDEADFFAACVLMPEQVFVAEKNKLTKAGYNENEIVSKLGETFGTNRETVFKRMEEVALVQAQS